jgi:prepilin-type N-terminal cleavage/methylation domain-containing protein
MPCASPGHMLAVRPRQSGFSLVELMLAIGILGVLFALGMPMLTTAIDSFRIAGDGRTIANAVAVAKMRAAATFTRGRLFVDLSGGSYRVQRWTGSAWVDDGTVAYLANRDTFGYGTVTTPPPSTQASISQAPLCKDSANADIANTACILFNSRGIPTDTTNAPLSGATGLYVTNGPTVYGVTISLTGLSRIWRTNNAATPNWVQQ